MRACYRLIIAMALMHLIVTVNLWITLHSKDTIKGNSIAILSFSLSTFTTLPLSFSQQSMPLPKHQERVTEIRKRGTTLLPLGQRLHCPALQDHEFYETVDDKVYQRPLFTGLRGDDNMRLGNAIAPYWCARAMALLGGYEYEGRPFGRSFLKYLPRQAPARPAEKEIFEYTCQVCPKLENSCQNFHKCHPGWLAIADTVHNDTRAALQQYAKQRPAEESDRIFRQFQPNDWLIYDRCCITCHSSHGFANIHVYEHLPKEEAYTIYTLRNPAKNEEFGNMCEMIHERRNAYLRQLYPKAKIVELRPSRLWVDFARLVFAPNVLLPSVGSSWLLWSALLANSGRVLTAPLAPNQDVSFVGGNYPFTVLDVPVMSKIHWVFPGRKESLLGYKDDPKGFEETKELILKWFMDGVQVDLSGSA